MMREGKNQSKWIISKRILFPRFGNENRSERRTCWGMFCPQREASLSLSFFSVNPIRSRRNICHHYESKKCLVFVYRWFFDCYYNSLMIEWKLFDQLIDARHSDFYIK
jgi:hypothetical protein